MDLLIILLPLLVAGMVFMLIYFIMTDKKSENPGKLFTSVKTLFKKFFSFNPATVTIVAVIVIVIASATSFIFGRTLGVSSDIKAEARQKSEKLNELNQEIDNVQEQLTKDTALLNEFNKYKNDKDTKKAEITQLNVSIQEKTYAVESLDDKISEKTQELERLNGAVTAAKSERILSAGVYIVGEDLDPGTYDVVHVSGRGNFFAHGDSYVNETFGTESRFHITEYKNMMVDVGDDIKISGTLKVKLLLQ